MPPTAPNRTASLSTLSSAKSHAVLSVLGGAADKYRQVNDRLRVILKDYDDLKPPAIVVVGEQSAGKSSVLSSLSGLPLSTGDQKMVTRCPLQLSMHRDTSAKTITAKFAMSLGQQRITAECNDVYHDFAKMTEDFTAQAMEYENKDSICERYVANIVIEVDVHGPDLSDLTLVDLPGLIQTDPQDMPGLKDAISNLVQKNTAGSESIIMVVGDATRDLTTIAGFTEAAKADPRRDRTVGVLTKLDKEIKEKGEDIAAKLNNQGDIKLPRGFVGVQNRRRGEESISLKQLRHNENITADIYRRLGVPQQSLGIESLAKKLCAIQEENLMRTAPLMQANLDKELSRIEDEIAALPPSLQDTELDRTRKFDNRVRDLSQALDSVAEAQSRRMRRELGCEPDNCVLTMMKQVFEDEMVKYQQSQSDRSIPGRDDAPLVLESLKKNAGACLRDIDPPEAFPEMVVPPIREMQTEATTLVRSCSVHVQLALKSLATAAFASFPESVSSRVCAVIKQHMEIQTRKFHTEVKSMFARELERPYTLNPHYTTEQSRLRNIADEMIECQTDDDGTEKNRIPDNVPVWLVDLVQDMTSEQRQEYECHRVIEFMIKRYVYLSIVVERVTDNVCMLAHQFFIAEPIKHLPLWLQLLDTARGDKRNDEIRDQIRREEIVEMMKPATEDIVEFQQLQRKRDTILEALHVMME